MSHFGGLDPYLWSVPRLRHAIGYYSLLPQWYPKVCALVCMYKIHPDQRGLALQQAIEHVEQLRPLEDVRETFWNSHLASREQEDNILWNGYLQFQLDPAYPDKFPMAYLNWMCEGQHISPGTLINSLDRGRARASGLEGNLTELAYSGRALREGWPLSEVEAASLDDLKEGLRKQKKQVKEDQASALKNYQQLTREALKTIPDTPQSPTEADALNLSALEVLIAKAPALYRALIHAAQTGDVSTIELLAGAMDEEREKDG